MTEPEWASERERFASDGTVVGPLARQLSELSHRLAPGTSAADVLRHVIEATKAALRAADLASVTMRDQRGEYHTPFHTDELAVRLDELQYKFGEGPCVEATRTPGVGTIDAPDVAENIAWVKWGRSAQQLGVHSVYAIGLFPYSDPPRMGALNIYGQDEETAPYKINGVFIFRGKDVPQLMKDVDDTAYYNWAKLDSSKPEDRAKFEELMTSQKIDGENLLERRYFK